MKRDLLWYRRHVIVAVSFAALVAFPQRGTLGQDGAGDGVIEASTNLSEALPASQWAQVESSVDRGLRWLANVQADDGRFPSDEIAQPAITSLAIMAFLSRGHLPDQGPYGENISRAIDFVLSTQRRRGYFSLRPVIPPSQHLTPAQTVVYNHSIAGLMLGEVYGMCSASVAIASSRPFIVR